MVLTSTSSGPEIPPPTSFVLRPFFVPSAPRGWPLSGLPLLRPGRSGLSLQRRGMIVMIHRCGAGAQTHECHHCPFFFRPRISQRAAPVTSTPAMRRRRGGRTKRAADWVSVSLPEPSIPPPQKPGRAPAEKTAPLNQSRLLVRAPAGTMPSAQFTRHCGAHKFYWHHLRDRLRVSIFAHS
jgi:hypothetical protein